MPNHSNKYADNKIYKSLKEQFGCIRVASEKLGFCQKTMWLIIGGKPMSNAVIKRIKCAGYSPVTFKKKRMK